jgi:hypothetical protein
MRNPSSTVFERIRGYTSLRTMRILTPGLALNFQGLRADLSDPLRISQ